MAVVAPTTAVCAVAIPVVVSVLLGERPVPLAVAGIALGMVSIVLVSQQQEGAQPQQAEPGSPRSRPSGVGTALASGIAIGLFLLSFAQARSEEHTSELQSRSDLVCRLLLEKKNNK